MMMGVSLGTRGDLRELLDTIGSGLDDKIPMGSPAPAASADSKPASSGEHQPGELGPFCIRSGA